MSSPAYDRNGKLVSGAEVEFLDLFQPNEAFIDLFYGRIRCGKTYGATAEILSDLRRGISVYANFKVNFEGYDERTNFWTVFLSLFSWKDYFFKFKKENFHYLPIDDEFMDKFEKLTDCKVYLDEGHVIFDSYQHAKFSMRKRTSILHTGHFNRSIIIISQRPTAIHVSGRANVNRFF